MKELKAIGSMALKKTQTLFTFSPQSSSKSSSNVTVIAHLREQLNDDILVKIEQLTAFIHRRIGLFVEYKIRPYRVTNMNYLAVEFIGQHAKFSLHITLAGYTEFPSLESNNSYRLYVEVCDATDGFWLIELLQDRLQKPFPDIDVNKTTAQTQREEERHHV